MLNLCHFSSARYHFPEDHIWLGANLEQIYSFQRHSTAPPMQSSIYFNVLNMWESRFTVMNENCAGNSWTALQTSDIHQKSMFTQLMPLLLGATPFPQRSYFTSKIFRRIYRTPSIFKRRGEVWKRKKPLSNRLHPLSLHRRKLLKSPLTVTLIWLMLISRHFATTPLFRYPHPPLLRLCFKSKKRRFRKKERKKNIKKFRNSTDSLMEAQVRLDRGWHFS